jgi:hypothetical protein
LRTSSTIANSKVEDEAEGSLLGESYEELEAENVLDVYIIVDSCGDWT